MSVIAKWFLRLAPLAVAPLAVEQNKCVGMITGL